MSVVTCSSAPEPALVLVEDGVDVVEDRSAAQEVVGLQMVEEFPSELHRGQARRRFRT